MNAHRKQGDLWDLAERITRILSLLAIPVVIAVVGGLIQSSLGRKTVSQQYVQVAVSILTSKEKLDDKSLRSWAVDLLNDNSPTHLSEAVKDKLRNGTVTLPSAPSPLDAVVCRLAQCYLKRLGYYKGGETGNYDNELYQAVMQFQKENSLEVDGFAGGQTIRKMLENYEKKYGLPPP